MPRPGSVYVTDSPTRAAGPSRARLRQLTVSEAVVAIDELLALAVETALIADQAPPDVSLATLSDLA